MARRVTFLLFNETEQSYQVCSNTSVIGHPFKLEEKIVDFPFNTTHNVKQNSILKKSSKTIEYREGVNPTYATISQDKTLNLSENCSTSNYGKEPLKLLCTCCSYGEYKNFNNTSNSQTECSDDAINEITFTSNEVSNKTESSCSWNSSADTTVTLVPFFSSTSSEIFESLQYIDDDEDGGNDNNDHRCAEQTSQSISTNSNLSDHRISHTNDTRSPKTTSTSADAARNDLRNYFTDASRITIHSSIFPSNNTSNINCNNSTDNCYEVNCDPPGCLIDNICTSHELHFKCPWCAAVKTLQPGLNYYYLLKHIFSEDQPEKIIEKLETCICPTVADGNQETDTEVKIKNPLARRVAKSLVNKFRRLTQQNVVKVKASSKQCVL
ncbi:hypothetical protein HELRODRAFT_180004 [Helobdella robusta]|uniref:Uncharacterized protein n=1 Tax=Helobdella robusta TaxID=6412 RepID=T1FFB9_HELRO|nr:hypothetical protein HELRODRAFT_180004 [Helobdella robusta]ESN94899.1 hypothetical protein HELRODRAFT_180004 [Helobdella robusta]